MTRAIPVQRRFWPKVAVVGNSCECWEWQAAVNPGGYGVLWNQTNTLAHRVSWELNNGPIPDGSLVLHHCDNTLCVNPHHLFLGTHADNARDRIEKQRSLYVPLTPRRGEQNSGVKLTVDEVHEFLKAKFLDKPVVNRETGECMGIRAGSTAKLDVAEMVTYLDSCILFAAEYLGVEVSEATHGDSSVRTSEPRIPIEQCRGVNQEM